MGKIIIGVDDLQTWCEQNKPSLISEWDYEKNTKLPNEYHNGSASKVWWKCSKGHSYEMQIAKKTKRNFGCPFCSGFRVCDDNNVAVLYPKLLDEWDYEKNGAKTLYEFTKGSGYKAWWKCSKGHSYQVMIHQKIRSKVCPYCCGQRVSIDNCLSTTRPDLLGEWNFDRNKNISPNEITPGSHKRVWWKCSTCGFEWESFVYNRGIMGCGCPKCDSKKRTSFPEQSIGYYLSKFEKVLYREKIENVEMDIFLPNLKIAIEYDGAFFHSRNGSEERDNKKNEFLMSKSIKLIRVKELKEKNVQPYLNETNYGCDIYTSYNQNYLFINPLIIQIIDFINKIVNTTYKINPNIREDRNDILEKYITNLKENSVAIKKPIGIKKWYYIKNGNVDPYTIPYSSKKHFWWKCPTCGYEWDGAFENLTDALTCSKCVHSHQSKAKIEKGKYNLFDSNPVLMEEWDYSKNSDVDPKKITPGSNIKVWWICKKCGYSWQAVVKNRNKGIGCPSCADKSRVQAKYKKVINIDTNEIYNSIEEAALSVNVGRTAITQCIKGRSKTAGGYHWKYYNDKEERK